MDPENQQRLSQLAESTLQHLARLIAKAHIANMSLGETVLSDDSQKSNCVDVEVKTDDELAANLGAEN